MIFKKKKLPLRLDPARVDTLLLRDDLRPTRGWVVDHRDDAWVRVTVKPGVLYVTLRKDSEVLKVEVRQPKKVLDLLPVLSAENNSRASLSAV